MIDLKNLLEMIEQFKVDPEQKFLLLAFVTEIELPPAVYLALLVEAPPDPKREINTYAGIEISKNGALPEHHALLKFGDGWLGLWDMRGSEVRMWHPGAQKL